MFCLFASSPELITIPTPPGAIRNRYRVNAVEVLKGPPPPLPQPGWELHRIEAATPTAASTMIRMQGETGTAQYTDPKAPYAAANGLSALPADANPVLAVIIPLRKSPAWHALSFEQRKALLPTHVDAGIPFIPTIHRRLFHCGAFTKDYDFLTYFEFRANDEPAFRQLCRVLRDPKRNPEWAYIDRDCEIWLTRLA